jgi:hypothetical protein
MKQLLSIVLMLSSVIGYSQAVKQRTETKCLSFQGRIVNDTVPHTFTPQRPFVKVTDSVPDRRTREVLMGKWPGKEVRFDEWSEYYIAIDGRRVFTITLHADTLYIANSYADSLFNKCKVIEVAGKTFVLKVNNKR